MAKLQLLLTSFTLALLVGCQSSPVDKQAETTTDTPATPIATAPDSIFVDVDSMGQIRFGGKDVPNIQALHMALTDSMQVLKKQGGKLPALGFRTHGDVLMGMRGALNDVFLAVQEEMEK